MKTIFTTLFIIAALFLSVPSVQAQYGGTMGSLTWTLTSDSTLTISGSGPMPDYGSYPQPVPPWQEDFGGFQLLESIKTVVIEPGVTTIGNSAFKCCINMTSITIPDGVTSIGEEAFYTCGKLPSITIPASVKYIKDGAFVYCSSLPSIALPQGLLTIGLAAFYGCSALASIPLPASLTSIGELAFNQCSALTSITIPDNVTSFGDQVFNRCYNLRSVTLGSGIPRIGNYTFAECNCLTSITLPNSVTTIANMAFRDCANLRYINLGNGVTNIEPLAIYGCNALTMLITTAAVPIAANSSSFAGINQANCSLYVPSGAAAAYRAAAYWQNFTAIKEAVSFGITGPLFWMFTTDGTLTIGGNGDMPDYTNYPFSPVSPWYWNASSIQRVVIQEGVTSIGNLAFNDSYRPGYAALTQASIPNSVSRIGREAFAGCGALSSITIPTNLTSIGQSAFSHTAITSFPIPNSVTTIGYGAFLGARITSVTIPAGVTTIAGSTFNQCTALTSVTLPKSLTSIGDYAFSNCTALTSITIPNSVTTIGQEAFWYCVKLDSVTIGSSVNFISEYAFMYCSTLKKIKLKALTPPVILDFSSTFDGIPSNCVLEVPAESKNLYLADDYWKFFPIINDLPQGSGSLGAIRWAFTGNGTLTISGSGAMPNFFPTPSNEPWYVFNESIGSIVIQDSVTAIGNYAFYKLTEATSLTIGKSVADIGDAAFADCSSLASVTFAPSGSLASIGGYAFLNCTALAAITIPDNMSMASIGAFYNSGLTSVTIGAGSYIGMNTFSECRKLTSITLSGSVTGIEDEAFTNCSALTKFRIKALVPPPVNAAAFSGINSGCVLEVPFGAAAAYSAAAYWNNFATINEVFNLGPACSVISASIASSTSITVNGKINNFSSGDQSASYYYIYGTDPDNLNQTTATQSGTVPANGSLNVSATLTGLTNGTLYYFKLISGENRSALSKVLLSSSIPTNNLKLWLRADMAVTSTGSAASAWGDVSGWNNDASQSSGGNQPTLSADAINAKPALLFNGSTSKLLLPASTSLGIQSNPYEMFIVAKSASGDIQFLIAGGATEQFEYHLNGAAGARFIPIASQFIDQGAAGYYTSGNAHVFSARASAVGGAVRVDGIDGAAPTGNLLSANSGSLMLGARSDNSYYLNGSIAEVIIYNTNLSTADRSKVENYLSSRYNITSGALPVELSSFTGAYGAQKVELKWTTAAEINNNGFKVERRAEKSGNADWEQIGFVQGYGNSNSHRNYAYTDKTPPCGKVSYRLRQVDSDGKYQFSGILELVIDLPVQNSLSQNYPNPFNPTTTIRYQLSNKADVSLIVYDMAGREAAVLASGQKSPGYYEAEFNGSKLASGIYIYKLKAGSFIQTKKLLLLK